MEREWRIYGRLEFNLTDVYRIIIPEAYARRLRSDLSDYYGQITYAESL
jgi:hypothetical protein